MIGVLATPRTLREALLFPSRTGKQHKASFSSFLVCSHAPSSSSPFFPSLSSSLTLPSSFLLPYTPSHPPFSFNPLAYTNRMSTAQDTTTKPTSKEEWIKAEDGHEIFTKTWYAVGTPVASVVFVHGLGEHIVRKCEVVPLPVKLYYSEEGRFYSHFCFRPSRLRPRL